MSTVQYHSAIYKINRSKPTATKMCFKEFPCDMLPDEIPLSDLSVLLSTMQKKCFKDANIDNENTNRLNELFASETDRTVAVVVSLGYLPETTQYMDFIDGGSATIQKSKQDFLPRYQLWINEVCRAKLADVSADQSPVKIVMKIIDIYISKHCMKQSSTIDGAYLYVEKHPEHGNPEYLLNYYSAYGYKELSHADDDYYYMRKKYPSQNALNRRTKKAKKRSSSSSASSKKNTDSQQI